MKRKMFIGSSSEGEAIAKKVKEIITVQCGDWIECVIWKEGVFKNNKSFLDSLVHASRRYDYGLLVATADDKGWIRRNFKSVPRDNVVFEMGLFLGSLGLTRAFLLAEKKSHLPSDYNGITIPKFSNGKVTENDLRLVIDQLKSTRNSYSLKPIPSASLALGYFDNFLAPFCKSRMNEDFVLNVLIPRQLSEISTFSKDYDLKNPSDDISVFGDNGRPIIKRLKSDNLTYWDIPSTLSTLQKLLDLVVHSQEIGINPEKKEWIDYELRNFIGSLNVLISESPFNGKKINIDWL